MNEPTTASLTASGNGHAPPPPFGARDEVEARLAIQLTEGYRPSLPLWALFTTDITPQLYLLRDIELMMIHPIVVNALNYFKAGISGAEFAVVCESPEVGAFIQDQCQRFWDRGVPKLQGGYEYGWIGVEAMYSSDEGLLKWDNFVQFAPRDVYYLTVQRHEVGIRVKNVPQKQDVDLWAATDDIPAKGVWYAHNPRYANFYGQSQLLGAWRPWRRLAWKDAAETIIDGGIFRFAYGGIVIKYPDKDFQGQPGSISTTNDSQGRPRRFGRDIARQMAELYKAGASIGLPSTCYPQEQGGHPEWEFDIPQTTLNVTGLITYAKYLADQISYGVGVPPELMAAAETGSGYSGRQIPLDAFLMIQQHIADALLMLFVRQVLKPLVRWNFGNVRWDVQIRSLLESRQRMKQGQQPEAPPAQEQLPGGGETAPDWSAMNTTPGPAGFSLVSIPNHLMELSKKVLARAA